MCFNPRPPIKAGESSSALSVSSAYKVSIRAHQLRRANPAVSALLEDVRFVSIRAHQLRRANRVGHAVDAEGHGVSIRAHQLRRANLAGRGITLRRSCFNPRPPIKAGESFDVCDFHEGVSVSIRAHQLRRANPATPPPENSTWRVSIRAHQLRRANQTKFISID